MSSSKQLEAEQELIDKANSTVNPTPVRAITPVIDQQDVSDRKFFSMAGCTTVRGVWELVAKINRNQARFLAMDFDPDGPSDEDDDYDDDDKLIEIHECHDIGDEEYCLHEVNPVRQLKPQANEAAKNDDAAYDHDVNGLQPGQREEKSTQKVERSRKRPRSPSSHQ